MLRCNFRAIKNSRWFSFKIRGSLPAAFVGTSQVIMFYFFDLLNVGPLKEKILCGIRPDRCAGRAVNSARAIRVYFRVWFRWLNAPSSPIYGGWMRRPPADGIREELSAEDARMADVLQSAVNVSYLDHHAPELIQSSGLQESRWFETAVHFAPATCSASIWRSRISMQLHFADGNHAVFFVFARQIHGSAFPSAKSDVCERQPARASRPPRRPEL